MGLTQVFSDIADAIREKSGSSDTYLPTEMAQAILDIQSGGAITYKNYAKFNGTGLQLPFEIDADYKVSVTFNQTQYLSTENIIGNTAGTSYSQLTVYGNVYYSSAGTSEGSWGTWSAGEHTFITNNGNNHNEFDGVEVQAYTPTTWHGAYYTIGIRSGAVAINSYIKEYKITSISTGNVLFHLKPALLNLDGREIPILFDTIEKEIYRVQGLTVMDTIPN